MDDPGRLQAVGGEADAETTQLHPEVVEFARWFADWWLRRGRHLVARRRQDEEDRRAA
jgi:hypothetical protein